MTITRREIAASLDGRWLLDDLAARVEHLAAALQRAQQIDQRPVRLYEQAIVALGSRRLFALYHGGQRSQLALDRDRLTEDRHHALAAVASALRVFSLI